MSHTPLKIAVAVSGGGRSLRNLIAQQYRRAYSVEAVIASRTDCAAVDLARQSNLPVWLDSFPKVMTTEKLIELETWLGLNQIDLIVLGGFLRPFPILQSFAERIINIHPALLPAYGGKGMYGMKVHEAVYAAGDRYSGATVHLVTERYDEGRIIAQIKVALANIESPQAIADRVFEAECKLYPEVIHQIALGKLPQSSPYYPIYNDSEL